MHYRRLGHSGLKVSELSLGAWMTFGKQVHERTARELIRAAYDQGVNYFDNADSNFDGQAESIMGKAIKGLPREALVISSKVFWPTMPGPNGRGLSRKHIFESIHASLRRLEVDYLDIYFCHRYDPDTPIEEVVFSMNLLIQQGKILYWGTSEWSAAQIAQAVAAARQNNLIPPAVEQPQYNLLHHRRVEQEILPLARELGIGLTTYSPLAFGILTGKYNQGIPKDSRAATEEGAWLQNYLTPECLTLVGELELIANELGVTPAQLAIAWVLRNKAVSSVIFGATNLNQLFENLAATEATARLSDEVLEDIEELIESVPDI